MNKEFVTYEIAQELQELGFNEPTICGYDKDKCLRGKLAHTNDHGTRTRIDWDKHDDHLHAPLWQQAFRWLRHNYGIRYILDWMYYDGFHYSYRFTFPNGDIIFSEETYNSFEENEIACLEKIISKIKERKNDTKNL